MDYRIFYPNCFSESLDRLERDPAEYDKASQDYGLVYLFATEELRAIYLDDAAEADAALAALDALESDNGGR